MNYRMNMTIGALLVTTSMSVGAAESVTSFTKQCEEALALSALCERLRDNATVYVLGKNGFEKVAPAAVRLPAWPTVITRIPLFRCVTTSLGSRRSCRLNSVAGK